MIETGCDTITCKKFRKSLTIQDVHEMFRNADTCDVSMVYVDNNKNDQVIHELQVKRFSDECHTFFTRRGNYYYFYNSLLHRLLLWSRHPRTLGKEGLVGHHTTIGWNDASGRWDIHGTEYGHFRSAVGNHKIIIPDSTHHYYVLDKHLYLHNDAPEHVKWLWDQLWCKKNIQLVELEMTSKNS